MTSDLDAQLAELRATGQFDADWYSRNYTDVAMTGLAPEVHYLRYGYWLGRDPNANFSTRFVRAVYGIKDEHEPICRLSWMQRRAKGTPIGPNSKRVLMAANQVATAGDHTRAIALAEAHLPADLAYTATILHANAALALGDEAAWQCHLNAYLAHFDAAPIFLEEPKRPTSKIFDRLACASLPSVDGGPLVSVIMPAWNAESTVEKAANSILTQTWSNLELLIIDDASTDETWSVLQRIAIRDTRVKIARNKVNVGPYVSKNIALMQAKGDWVTGHDADDWAHPQRLERHLAAALSRGLVASLAYMIRIKPSGVFSHITQQGTFSADGVARKALISLLLKRDVATNQLGYWDTVRFGADSEMIQRAETVFGDCFGVIMQISMICQDLETSLTNDPVNGVKSEAGISPIRMNYRDSWRNWLEKAHRDELFLQFPQARRRYDAANEMVVSWENQIKNMPMGQEL